MEGLFLIAAHASAADGWLLSAAGVPPVQTRVKVLGAASGVSRSVMLSSASPRPAVADWLPPAVGVLLVEGLPGAVLLLEGPDVGAWVGLPE
jgi:hypothetical protein